MYRLGFFGGWGVGCYISNVFLGMSDIHDIFIFFILFLFIFILLFLSLRIKKKWYYTPPSPWGLIVTKWNCHNNILQTIKRQMRMRHRAITTETYYSPEKVKQPALSSPAGLVQNQKGHSIVQQNPMDPMQKTHNNWNINKQWVNNNRTLEPLFANRPPFEDSDQTAQMRRQIWVFDGRAFQFVFLLDFRANMVYPLHDSVQGWEASLLISSDQSILVRIFEIIKV